MAKSDEALMLQLQTGDLRSFDTLVKRWEKPLLNYCYRMVNDIALAEDLRQEVFLRIYRSAKTYRPTAQFSTWMYRIATNLCLDTLAKQQRRKETPMQPIWSQNLKVSTKSSSIHRTHRTRLW